MSQPDLEHLLGGHATGTLSAEEKARLYRAALDDQALFDALMDEEALRELLADPALRARILADLPAPAVRPLWRRPAVLGAASLLLMATTSVVLLRRQPASSLEPHRKQAVPLRLEEAPGPETPKEAPRGAPSQVEAPKRLPPARQTPAQQELPRPDSRPSPQLEAVRELAPAAAPPPPPPALQNTPTAASGGAAPSPANAEEARRRAEGEAARSKSELKKATRETSAVVEVVASSTPWHLEDRGQGRLSLRVQVGRDLHPVLLRRTAGAVELLRPAYRTPGPDGEVQVTYLLTRGPGDVLDLYLLKRPPARPLDLPESGAVDGEHWRL